jgi:hypothetical protein
VSYHEELAKQMMQTCENRSSHISICKNDYFVINIYIYYVPKEGLINIFLKECPNGLHNNTKNTITHLERNYY